MAARLHRARNRRGSARVSAASEWLRRSVSVQTCEVVPGVLSRNQNALVTPEGYTSDPVGAAARLWARDRVATGRWSPSSVRTQGSLKLTGQGIAMRTSEA